MLSKAKRSHGDVSGPEKKEYKFKFVCWPDQFFASDVSFLTGFWDTLIILLNKNDEVDHIRWGAYTAITASEKKYPTISGLETLKVTNSPLAQEIQPNVTSIQDIYLN